MFEYSGGFEVVPARAVAVRMDVTHGSFSELPAFSSFPLTESRVHWDPTASFGSIEPLNDTPPGCGLPKKAEQEFFYSELTLAVIDASPGAAIRACSRCSATSLALTLSITSSKLQG